jgi:hypothetical protein
MPATYTLLFYAQLLFCTNFIIIVIILIITLF